MCFYYAIVKKNPRKLVEKRVITEKQLDLFQDTYLINGFENPRLPVINEKQELMFMEWGLIPVYITAENEKRNFRQKYNTLNAKCETIFDSKMYAEVIKKRRCLVICSGFFEWRTYKGKKYPYYITLKEEDVFVFAGIYNENTNKETGEISSSFSIITTHANELMETIHNTKKRMPLILEPESALRWISPELKDDDIRGFLKPIESHKIKAHTIQKFVPSQAAINNNSELLAYYHYPELTQLIEKQGDLFEEM